MGSLWSRPGIRGLMPLVVVLLAATAPAGADDGSSAPQGPPPVRASAPIPASPDFLLGAPRAWLGLRGSMLFPRAGGDLFAFVSDQLTVDRTDLRARGFSGDLGFVVTPKVDVVTGFDIARREVGSEYRHLVASNRQPIEQQTRLNQTSVSAGIRFSPTGRGRRISEYAFIPKRLAPYAGAGLTMEYFSFAQRGQFVDFTDQSIFNDRFVSNGWTAGPYVNGGVDVQAWKRLYLSFDGRYTWMRSDLSSDFSGFDGIDLAGFRGSTGISVLF